MKNGRSALFDFTAASRHSLYDPVGATNWKSSCASQNSLPSSSAPAMHASSSNPVTTQTAQFRGSSAQAYLSKGVDVGKKVEGDRHRSAFHDNKRDLLAHPTQIPASKIPFLASIFGTAAYVLSAGGRRVLVCSKRSA